MDATPVAAPAAALSADALAGLAVTGAAGLRRAADEDVDVLPWLKSRKSRKFMARQDELATAAAGAALRDAGLLDDPARHAMGLYLAVGHLAFGRADIEAIADRSLDGPDGAFSMRRFAAEGIDQVNPLLAFRCLPNMPAFHVSMNFELRGPYLLLYPGVAQAYAVLAQACLDLQSGRVERALVGGVADQSNFLVDFHFARDPLRRALPRGDGAGFFVLEREDAARRRGARARLRPVQLQSDYRPQGEAVPHHAGAADLPLALAEHLAQREAGAIFEHRATSIDHCELASRWESCT